ncbi:NmrA family transcriptional regulator [Sphaerisporangium rufum]|uniref:NmrA family transcriptional regulator n=1 Tax=Sphaerisporangium rufum TaxID=1381558 RepID=A0A919QZR7_9ACTN|nr:NmrA family NAD(P)-binding protein [Sphaerisporangium rufum]GII75766.1 NmrA family transcriptional regulator [Sphaerisporangium rufum]
MEPILVTGAAGGRQGSTGMRVARLLLERGRAVRALVRQDDARAARLREWGAQVVLGDLREITSVMPALRGVRRAFFTYPVSDGMLEAAAVFAAAARREGLDRVVEVSQLAADPYAGTPHMRRHWVAEELFDRAGVGAVHLRAGVFFENLAVLVRAAGGRELALPLGPPDTVLPLVAAADVARVAAGLLSAPAGEPDPICRITGEVMSIGAAVRTFGTGLVYVEQDPEEWRRKAMALYEDAVAVEHLSALWELFRQIGAHHELYEVTESIRRFGGRAPMTLREFATEEGPFS